MAIDTEKELLEHEETIDTKMKMLQHRIEEHTDKQFKDLKEQLEEIQKHVDVSKNLVSKFGGSKFGGSIINGGDHGGSVINAHH